MRERQHILVLGGSCSWYTIIRGHGKRLMDLQKNKSSQNFERWTSIWTGETSHAKLWKSEAKYDWKECVEEAINIF